MNLRESSVAGMFYPKQKNVLEKQLTDFFKGLKKESKTSAVIAPHAGYEYSGKTAAVSFNALAKAKTFILLGPNHTGLGSAISISNADCWETPLGKIEVDSETRKKLLEKLSLEADDLAHLQEHSIEVQLPFLQFLFSGFKIVPISIMATNFSKLIELGNSLAEICKEENVSIIASSDFSHFLPLENAREKDLDAISFIEKLDIKGFYGRVMEKRLSICGFAPITALMQYCRQKAFKKARLLKYDSSATATKDTGNVVGYAAISFEK
ncbi:MAG TPA: AmmeMemoRadiSam system protein B [archaeon]|nr:AmmeMemoRadiSam system protein B [archaeon]